MELIDTYGIHHRRIFRSSYRLINNANKEIFTDGTLTPNLSGIFDLLKSEQNSPSPIIYLPPPLYIDTFISQKASHIIIGSYCESDV